MTLDNILEQIQKSEKIVILTHENPDGDAVGSSLAMYMTLQKMGKKPDLIIPELPRNFAFFISSNILSKVIIFLPIHVYYLFSNLLV